MVPRQINGVLAAHNFNTQQAAEMADMQAWMTAAYYRAKELPEKPIFIQKPKKPDEAEMTAEDMEERLTMFADVHNAIEGVKP